MANSKNKNKNKNGNKPVSSTAKKAVKKVKIPLDDGSFLMIPDVTEDQMPFGFRRRTRHLKTEEQQEEIFWLLLETFLNEDELAAWDAAGPDAAASAMESMEAQEQGKD